MSTETLLTRVGRLDDRSAPTRPLPLGRPRLPGWAAPVIGATSAVSATATGLLLGWSTAGITVLAVLLFAVALPLASRLAEGPRAARDRLVTVLVWSALGVALVPLVSLTVTVVHDGIGVVDAQFLTYSMRNVVGEGGGIYHAIMGTLLVTLAAALLSVPVGLLSAIYLVEYAGGSRAARVLSFLVDVMTGIPSIVAGLFAYAVLVLFFGEGVRMGLGGSLALSVLMVPIVVRSCEEMLRLVPHDLREASYALGVPQWRTVLKVVLPTALPGIITGVMLAVARVVGETAPLLIVAGSTDSLNLDLFSERMMTLPVFIYSSFTQPGVPAEYGVDRAWGAALVLIVIVVALNVLARLLGRLVSRRSGR